jgi:hypothetical protein
VTFLSVIYIQKPHNLRWKNQRAARLWARASHQKAVETMSTTALAVRRANVKSSTGKAMV